MTDRPPPTENLEDRLTPEQIRVTQHKGTEAPFSGKYVDEKGDGMYRCVVCGKELFRSETKYDSGSGWPSFHSAEEGSVTEKEDTSHGMRRIEVVCGECEAHLGHVFPDGPGPTGMRYCINSAALDFEKENARPTEDDDA